MLRVLLTLCVICAIVPLSFHKLIVGPSGCGKGAGETYDLKASLGKTAIVYMTPRYESAMSVLREFASYPNILLDVVGSEGAVVPLQTIPRGEESDVTKDRTIEVLDSFTDGPLYDQPIKLTGCEYLIDAWLDLKLDIPVAWVRFLYEPGHPLWDHLFYNLSEELQAHFWPLKKMHPSTLLQTYQSSDRIWKRTFGHNAVMRRDVGHGLSWERIINERFVVITTGDRTNSTLDSFKAVAKLRSAELTHYLESTQSDVSY